MSDYTPTTDHIRNDYLRMGRKAENADEFDRWLAEHDAELIEGLATEAGYSLVYHEEAEAFLRREARQRREEKP